MNVVETKTSSLILSSVIWLPDCPDAGDAITDYTRTENTQPASTGCPRKNVPMFKTAITPSKMALGIKVG